MYVFLGMAYWLSASFRHYASDLKCPATEDGASAAHADGDDANLTSAKAPEDLASSSSLGFDLDLDLDLDLLRAALRELAAWWWCWWPVDQQQEAKIN